MHSLHMLLQMFLALGHIGARTARKTPFHHIMYCLHMSFQMFLALGLVGARTAGEVPSRGRLLAVSLLVDIQVIWPWRLVGTILTSELLLLQMHGINVSLQVLFLLALKGAEFTLERSQFLVHVSDMPLHLMLECGGVWAIDALVAIQRILKQKL